MSEDGKWVAQPILSRVTSRVNFFLFIPLEKTPWLFYYHPVPLLVKISLLFILCDDVLCDMVM